MNDVRKIKRTIAESIIKVAVKTANKTVGRSFPQGTHEVEVPDKVRQYLTRENCK